MRRIGIFCIVLAVLLAITGCGKEVPETAPTTMQVTEPVQKEMSVTDLLKAVLTLKDDLETAIEEIKGDELPAAEQRVIGMFKKTQTIRESMAVSLENLIVFI